MEPFYINSCSSTTKITSLLRDRRKLLQNNYDDKSFSNYSLNSDNYSNQDDNDDDEQHNQHSATLNRKISNRFTIDLFRRNTISSMNLVLIILLVILVSTQSSFAARQEGECLFDSVIIIQVTPVICPFFCAYMRLCS